MKLPFIRGVLALFFRPSYAKRISREHHAHLNSPEKISKQQGDEPWPEQQITILRRSWLSSLLTVALVLPASWFIGKLLAAYVTQDVSVWQAALQYTGAGLLLWVTLGQGGWSIQSTDGNTYAEHLDEWVHRFIHVLGTALFVAGTAWSLAAKA